MVNINGYYMVNIWLMMVNDHLLAMERWSHFEWGKSRQPSMAGWWWFFFDHLWLVGGIPSPVMAL